MKTFGVYICGLLAMAIVAPGSALADTDLLCTGLATVVQPFEIGQAEMKVHLSDKAAVFQLPAIMSDTPELTISGLVYSDDAIAMNGSQPILGFKTSVNIDRDTGYIRLVTHSGSKFTGTCRKVDPAAPVTKLF